jgi:hypothetical protein
MDVNADSLPDVLVTAPGLFGGRQGVFFNGLGSAGGLGFAALSQMDVEQLGAVDENVLKLNNTNVAPLDLDADGIINLVHMPREKTYSVFSPVKKASGWPGKGARWQPHRVRTSRSTSRPTPATRR